MKDWRSENDKMSGRVWKALETQVGKVKIAEIERRRGRRGNRKEVRRKEKREEANIEKAEEEKGNRSKEGS